MLIKIKYWKYSRVQGGARYCLGEEIHSERETEQERDTDNERDREQAHPYINMQSLILLKQLHVQQRRKNKQFFRRNSLLSS